MGAIKFSVSLVFIMLFSIAIITTQQKWEEDNGASTINDLSGRNRILSLNGTVRDYETQANTSIAIFAEASAEDASENTKTPSQFQAGATSLVPGATNASKSAFGWVFGGDGGSSMFFIAFLSLITIAFGAYAIAAWRGNPD